MLVAAKVCVALMLCIGLTSVGATATCDESEKLVCMNCRQIGKCPSIPDAEGDDAAVASVKRTESEAPMPVEEGGECPANQACLEILNTAVCVSVASTSCDNCNGQPTACDPYDNTLVHSCVPGKTPVEVEKCEDKACRSGECSDSTEPTNPTEACSGVATSSWVTIKPTCDTGFLCVDGETVKSFPCSENQYFDVKAYKCKNLPINLCGGETEGFFANPTNCKEGVICLNGGVVATQPCENGQAYNATTRACEDEGGVECPPLDGCTFESNEPGPTTTPESQVPVTPSSTVTSSPVTPQPVTSSSPVTPQPVTSSSSPVTPQPVTSSSPVTPQPVTSSSPVTPSSRPATCSVNNMNQRYPHETDCKKYYTCRKINSSSYAYVQSTCIGTLVFNSDTNLRASEPLFSTLTLSTATCRATFLLARFFTARNFQVLRNASAS
ncbi:Chitin binding domain [Trinorchestia longiramus]|nr:Chitin binding domain [Trinorchestia longiramus]